LWKSARRLIDLANEAGGRDNTSVILVRVASPESLLEAAEEQQELDIDDDVPLVETTLHLPDPVVH